MLIGQASSTQLRFSRWMFSMSAAQLPHDQSSGDHDGHLFSRDLRGTEPPLAPINYSLPAAPFARRGLNDAVGTIDCARSCNSWPSNSLRG